MRSYTRCACLVLVLTCIHAQGHNQPKKTKKVTPIDLSSFTPDIVKPIFDLMRKYGERERDRINQEEDRHVNQYLIIIVASQMDIKNAKTWTNGFPSEFTKEKGNVMRRLTFLLNKNNHGLPFYNPNRELHGEIQSIDLGFIENMMNNFNSDYISNPQYPLVLMYSHFIPCANVNKLGYSCAEELKNFALNNQTNYGLLVAYTEFFKNTDVKASLKFMKEGGVIAFQNMDGHYYQTVKYYPPTSLDGKGTTFQEEYFDCLSSLPVAHCCTGVGNNRKAILAFFINDVTYNCTSTSKASKYFTQRSRNELKLCIRKVIDNRVSSGCIQCSSKSQKALVATRNLFKFCLYYSADVTSLLGRSNNPYAPSWTPCLCAWKYLYRKSPQKNKKVIPNVMCANRILSIESLCSDVTTPGNKRSSKYAKKLIKYLRNKYEEFLIENV